MPRQIDPTTTRASKTLMLQQLLTHGSGKFSWICPLPRTAAVACCAMCGIVGYVGHRPACDVVIDALRRLKYRGYDSGGVALVNGRGTLKVRRRAGRLADLEASPNTTDPATLRTWLEEEPEAGRTVLAYGAPSRAVALFSRAGGRFAVDCGGRRRLTRQTWQADARFRHPYRVAGRTFPGETGSGAADASRSLARSQRAFSGARRPVDGRRRVTIVLSCST